MGKFNKKDEGVKPTIVNHMGEKAYKPNAEEELVSTVMTTMLSDSYYEKEKDKVNRIKDLMDQVDPYFAAQTALYVRKEGKLRSVTHLMASVLASKASGKEWASRFYNKIVMRPDDMSEILGCYAALNDKNPKKLRGISSAIKKGFKTALEGLDPYRIDKYKMDSRVITMVDLVNLFHPKGNQANKTAFQYLIEGRSLSGLYESKILINYEYDRSRGVLWNNKKSFTAGGDCGGATENGLFAFLNKCVKDKIKVDNLYVISDMQIGDGESVVWEKSSNYKYGKFAELLKGFKKVNPNCKIVSISIQGYGSEMFYRGSNILNIAGWSESIFDVINSKFCGYKNMIEEIKKIKI